MDEARVVNKIKVYLSQEKMDYINYAHAKEVECWKKIALDNKNKEERKQLTDLSPLRVFFIS